MGIFKSLIESLFVDKYNCIVCNDELREPNEYGLCDSCKESLPKNDGNICLKCGKHMRDEAKYCITCQNNDFFFDICRSRYIYKDDAKRLVQHMKFGGGKYITKYMAAQYVDMYREYGYNADVVVSVPISENRYRERGYNQAHEIAKVVADRLGLPYIEGAVSKIKNVRPQEELGARERLKNVVGAYRLERADEVTDKNILLIDDILTTGATMSAVALELKQKCNRVEALVFASPELRYKEREGDLIDDYIDELDKY